MMDEIKLSKTTPIEKYVEKPLRNILIKLYQAKGYKMILAVLLNSLFTEKKYTFLIDKKSLELLINNDSNLKKNKFKFSLLEEVYHHFIKTIENAQFVERLKKIKNLEDTFVMTLSHPHLLDYFYHKVGRDALNDQKAFVLQMVDATLGFYREDDLEFIPKQKQQPITWVDGGEEGVIEGMAVDPLFEARKKAIKLGLVKSQMGDEIREVEETFIREKVRYKSLLDRAKLEDQKRLALSEESDDLEENSRIIQLSVEAGINAQKQKKLLDEIELKLLKLKEMDGQARVKRAPQREISL